MIPIVPQRTHGATTRHDPEPHAKTGRSRDGADICERDSTAWHCNGTGSLPTSAGYLAKKRCADNGLPRRGAIPFILLSLNRALSVYSSEIQDRHLCEHRTQPTLQALDALLHTARDERAEVAGTIHRTLANNLRLRPYASLPSRAVLSGRRTMAVALQASS
jgi:hypothetical protein